MLSSCDRFLALLQKCDDDRRLTLLRNLAPKIGMVACHKQGSFSIQAMMDGIRTPLQIGTLADALSPNVNELILNCSGHYGAVFVQVCTYARSINDFLFL